eukprot:jgi/Tetstr1/432543/TSEL_021916.t1
MIRAGRLLGSVGFSNSPALCSLPFARPLYTAAWLARGRNRCQARLVHHCHRKNPQPAQTWADYVRFLGASHCQAGHERMSGPRWLAVVGGEQMHATPSEHQPRWCCWH